MPLSLAGQSFAGQIFAGVSRRDALKVLTAKFEAAGIDTPDRDARWLLAHALGVEPLRLLTDRDVQIEIGTAAQIESYATRRLQHEPVSRIIGERWFYGRPFKINSATLDPRPESETLIEVTLGLVREMAVPTDELRILDIGTGSGCLLLTLLAELPGAHGIGTDVSGEALAMAAENARRLTEAGTQSDIRNRVPRHAEWRLGAGFAPTRGETFDIIVCNPPYIPTSEIDRLDPDVRHFDPLLALHGGVDGLRVYKQVTDQVSDALSKGWIVFEVGQGQAAAVAEMLRSAFAPENCDIRIVKDMAGIERCVAASPRNSP